MPKRVAIIDIGSNSLRLVIFQRTSRFGFHLINKLKSDARISEGSFENGGYLQEEAINRAIKALSTFKDVIRDYKAKKTLIIATAAVRNAPNRYQFLKRVRDELKLKIKLLTERKRHFYQQSLQKIYCLIRDAITIHYWWRLQGDIIHLLGNGEYRSGPGPLNYPGNYSQVKGALIFLGD